jgi:hypothetical protein
LNGDEFYLFTGRYDRHNKEIYEGDILKIWNDWYTEQMHIDKWSQKCVVSFVKGNANFYIGNLGRHESGGTYIGEIIGDIKQNPELLEGLKINE